MKYTHLLFDLDNTILDFTASSLEALKEFALLIQVPYDQAFLDVYHDINHAVWTEFEHGLIDSMTLRRKRFELTAAHFGHKIDGLLMNRKYMKSIVNHTIFVDGAQEILDTFRGSHQMSIITNGLKEVQRPRLKEAKIYDHFEHIVVSDEIGLAKPDARYFDYAWQKAGSPDKNRVLVIGDNPNSDIKGAKNFGFDACLFDPKNLHKDHLADYKISEMSDLLQIIN